MTETLSVAGELRQAAARMRQDAGAKGHGPWCCEWTPEVALAVADWLDYCANEPASVDQALVVAREYMGES